MIRSGDSFNSEDDISRELSLSAIESGFYMLESFDVLKHESIKDFTLGECDFLDLFRLKTIFLLCHKAEYNGGDG